MFNIIWQYQVKEEHKIKFEEIYSTNGLWADLFKRSQGYLGTELFQDEINSQFYLTIDHWKSKQDFESFQSQWQEAYKLLDEQCEGLTEKESLLGKWHLK
ncbi:MAG: antibiotic biosynthesis monooxygenase [Anaerolineales bacterium]|nr:antibiotic biosynthesis monooxygenase [Anaerolineales bacterium]